MRKSQFAGRAGRLPRLGSMRFGAGVTPPGDGFATSVTVDGITIGFAESRLVVSDFGGYPVVVVPDGTTLTVTSATPDQAVLTQSGTDYIINGAMIDPDLHDNTNPNLTAFDQRVSPPAFPVAKLASFPASLGNGQRLAKVIANTSILAADRRQGVHSANGLLNVINETKYNELTAIAPLSQWVPPAPFDWSGRSAWVWRRAQMAPLQTLRPGLSLAGLSTPAASIIAARQGRRDFGNVATISTSESGYEALTLYGSGRNGSNYGMVLAETMRIGFAHYMGTTDWTEIEPFIRQWIVQGSWWFDQMQGRGVTITGDGGHYQDKFLKMVLALIATDRVAEIPNIATVFPGNQIGQAFFLTAGHMAALVPHDGGGPHTYRRRPVTAISGADLTVTSRLSGEPTYTRFFGLECRKASDNSLIGIVASANESSGSSNAPYTVTLDRTITGLTTSDQVYFAMPPGWYAEGDPAWSLTNGNIGTGFNNWNPSPIASYNAANFWAGDLLMLAALGLDDLPAFAAFKALVMKQVYDYDLPTAMNTPAYDAVDPARKGSGPGMLRLISPFAIDGQASDQDSYAAYIKDFWDAHAVSLNLGPPIAGTVTLAAASYPNGAAGPFVAPFLGSTGRDYGIIPLSGTGTPGAIIQARAYDDEFAGANTTAWQTIATVDGSGNWSADWHCPLTRFWALPEVRVSGLDATIQRGTARFAVGLVADLKGQSEVINGFDTAYISTAQRPTVTAPGNVFISRFGAGEEAGAWVTETGYAFSGGLPAFIANYIQERFPGLKARLGYDARGGTGPDQALDDDNPLRNWSDTVAVWNATTYSGYIKPSVLALHWFVNTEVYGANYGRLWAEILTQKRANGTPFTLPAALETTYEAGGTVTVEHTYAELYDDDYANTKVMCGSFASTHGFYANHQTQRQAFIDARASLPHFAAIVEDADFTDVLPHSRGTAANGDLAHPSFFSVAGQDGAARFHRSLLDGVIRCAGLVTTYSNPVFTNFEVAADGSYADLWSASYPVNSIWGIRGETIPTGARPAIGIAVNKARPDNAEFVAGRLRVYPPSGQTFDGYDIFSIDEAPANMSSREVGGTEIGYQYWKGFPIVPAAEIPGATALEGVPIDLNKTKTLYPNLLVNNLAPPAAPILVNQATGDGQLFRSGVLPATGRHLIFGARFNTAATINGSRVYDIGADGCTCFVQGTSGLMRVTLRSGTTVIFQADYAITRGTVLNHIVTVDAPNRAVKVYELTGDELIGSVTPITPTTTLTAWTASVFVLRGGELRLFDQSGGGRSLEASSLGQVVVAMTSATSDLAKFIDLGGANEAADVMALSQRMKNGGISPAYASRAQVVIGDDTAVASWNAGTMNDGTAPNSGWTKTGTFA